MTPPAPSTLTRRRLLGGLTAGACAILLAACGGQAATSTAPPAAASAAPSTAPSGASSSAPSAAPSTAPSAAPAGTPAASGASARPAATASGGTPATGTPTSGAAPLAPVVPVTPRTAASRGELRYVTGVSFPANTDATKQGYNMISYGVGETLTRLTPQNTLEFWLAESVANLNATTWRVKLRPNLRFWDNTAVDATAVAAAFRTNWETQAAANGLIDKTTTVAVVDPLTLDFTLPRPAGNFPFALSSQYFVIHKEAGKTMTGMYRPTKFETDTEMTLEAFAGHWGGPPPIARIVIKNVRDANTRNLALQSGEVDMIGNVLPEAISTFGPDIATVSLPSTRVHMALLNAERGVLADRQVREATAYAIDRAALLRVALSGQGEALGTIFPTSANFDQVALPTFDAARARQLLDAAGWAAGADGVRAKGGTKLAFTLLSYPGRPELTQMAVAIQAQLKAFGYDMQVREVQQIDPELQKAEYDASMYSVNSLITGDPLYFYNITMGRTSTYNYAKHEIPGIEPLLGQLRDEADPAKRQAISRQIQELVKTDVPILHLAAAPLIFAYRKDKVRDFAPHPNDLYLFNGALKAN